MSLPSITVISLTRHRIALLRRCIQSVEMQDYTGQIKHMILVDDCLATRHFLETNPAPLQRIEWYWIPRMNWEYTGPSRVAKLRNLGVDQATTDYIAFLDDDNEYETNHLSSLVECIKRTGCPAVHSYEQILWPDGKPYLDERVPWCRDPQEGHRQYLELKTKGIFRANSNISHDRADPKDHPNPARTVDMGEWLFRRELLQLYRFSEEYSDMDWETITTEDDKLMHALIDGRVSIASTKKATFRYYLGGYTNTFGWERR